MSAIVPQQKWMPSDYQDEVIPPARPSPSDWIKPLGNGTFGLEAPDDDACEAARILRDGEKVNFQWTATVLSIEYARGHTRPLFWPFVAGAETYALISGDPDSLCADLAALDELISEVLYDNETVEIEFYCWSDDVTFIFMDGAFHPEKGDA